MTMKEYIDNFKKDLPTMRCALKITQADLAKAAGVRRETICNWERGRYNLSLDVFIAIHDYIMERIEGC